jgi:hypothetical protein
MNNQTDIETILVELHIDGKLSLFLLLAAEGLINRMEADKKMYIGKAPLDIFASVSAKITPSLLQCFGGKFEAKDRQGQTCGLSVVLGLKDGRQLLSQWRYGSESTGPYPELRDFVFGAIAATDPWFAKQVERTRRAHDP